MLALLLSQNVLEKCWGIFCKRNTLNERKHKQETNIRQHNATLGHNGSILDNLAKSSVRILGHRIQIGPAFLNIIGATAESRSGSDVSLVSTPLCLDSSNTVAMTATDSNKSSSSSSETVLFKSSSIEEGSGRQSNRWATVLWTKSAWMSAGIILDTWRFTAR